MAKPDTPTADQRAALRLLVRQGLSLSDVAEMLGTEERAVHDRAVKGLVALTGEPRRTAAVTAARREQLASAVLSGAGADEARDDGERRWLRAAEQALSSERSPAPGSGPAPARPEPSAAPVSRVGGAILLGIAAAAAILALLFVFGVFGDGDGAATVTTTTATDSTGATDGTRILQQVNLAAPNGAKAPLGVANIAEQGGKRGIAVVGEGLPASSFYVLWLQRGDSHRFLGFFPPVRPSGKQRGRLVGFVRAPTDIEKYERIVVSRERGQSPKRPGNTILSGRLGG